MKWVHIQFSVPADGSHINPSLCHPLMAQRRLEYVCAKYKVTVTKTEKRDTAFLDLGGMVMNDSPKVSVRLGADRKFWVWQHQISYVLEYLRDGGRLEQTPAGKFHTFQSFPAMLVHLSDLDLKKAIKALEKAVKYEDEQAHAEATMNVLVKANLAMNPDVPEEEIREDLQGLRNQGKKVFPKNEVN